jgi:hypothetical protein
MTSWELVETTGLLDDADITITGAEFNYDAGYANGEQLLLILSGTSTHPDYPEFTQFFSIGKGWETLDQGATVVGEATGFHKNSQYGHFIQGAIESGAGEVLQARGMPDKASIWVGLKFHVKRVDVDYGGEIGVKQVLKPTAFLGEVGKADAPAPQVAETGATPTEAAGGNGVLKAEVIALANSAANHDAFLEEVITKHPDIQKDPALFADVVDPDGLYARVNA